MIIGNKTITKQLAYKIVGFALVGLVVLGVLIYLGLIVNQKRQFAQAEKEMDSLAAKIVEKVGKPDQQKKEKSCGYASREFGRGPRSCGVSIYMLYENKDINQANVMAKTLSRTLNIMPSEYTMDKYLVGGYRYEFTPGDGRAIDQTLGADLKTNSSKSCSIELVHPVVSSSYTNMFNAVKEENFLVGIVCAGDAMAEYFPVTKN